MKHSFPGFLLIESMIALVVLSFTIVLCAGGILSMLKEYSLAQKRLNSINKAQSLLEAYWHDDHDMQSDCQDLYVSFKSIKHGILLPTQPPLKLQCIEIIAKDNRRIPLLAGGIKE